VLVFFSGAVTSSNKVAFSAPLSNPGHQSNFGTHLTIVFDRVYTNTDNIYSPNTGVFRIPVSGTYVVSVYITLGQVQEYAYFEVVENGSNLGDIIMDNRVYGSTDSHATGIKYNSGFKQWLFHLSQGSEVWVRLPSYSPSSSIHGNGHSMFNAWLLFSDN